MRFKMLVENDRLNRRFLKEHGLSLLITFGKHKILLDTGSTGKYLKNARMLEENLQDVQSIIISHGHIDHIGGLQYFDDTPSLRNIFISKNAFQDFWLKVGFHFLNVGPRQLKLEHLQHKMTFVSEDTSIFHGGSLLTMHQSTNGTTNLYAGNSQNRKKDDFSHELILVLEENGELIVVTGCSHNGIVRILENVITHFPGKKMKAVIGGFHLIKIPYINNLNMSQSDVKKLAQTLNDFNVETYYSCHCTGEKAFKIMRKTLGNRLKHFPTGMELDLTI